jgi:N utilization substance protein A
MRMKGGHRPQANVGGNQIELGIDDGLQIIPGVTRLMCSVFAEHGINSIEDLAGCATDDLTGWSEFRNGQAVRHRGILDGFGLSRQHCEAMILVARVKIGWITS